jgi:hypothetical protein
MTDTGENMTYAGNERRKHDVYRDINLDEFYAYCNQSKKASRSNPMC